MSTPSHAPPPIREPIDVPVQVNPGVSVPNPAMGVHEAATSLRR